MSLRFRKSIKLAPGIRWNISGSGSSWTIGPRGSSVSIGKRGTFLNTGIPGTGLSWRTRLSDPTPSPASDAAPARPQTVNVSLTCEVQDDGSITFVDAQGKPASDYLIELAKKQKRDALVSLIKQACDKVNSQVEALGGLHLDTPDSRQKPTFVAPRFEVPQPLKPTPTPFGFWDKLLSSRKAKVEAANERASDVYAFDSKRWRQEKEAFDQAVSRRKLLVERLIYQSDDAMEIFLEESLHDIVWPRETTVSLEVHATGAGVLLDIDLPEIEDMPTRFATVPARGLKLSVKDLPPTKVKRLYAAHVHGVMFRMVGEAFAALPAVKSVTASGFSQRRDPATAQLRDDYLLSVRVERSAWELNDFKHLDALDVVEALARFDLRRDMTKAGLLKTVVPH